VVGLTGGIASGKSTVSKLLHNKHDIPVIDADVLAREVVEPGTPAYDKITRYFGDEVILKDGTGKLDRKRLGDIVFADHDKRQVLNGIVHPAVRKAMLAAVVKCWLRGERVCIVDVPLLIETGLWRYCGYVVVIYWSVPLSPYHLLRPKRLAPLRYFWNNRDSNVFFHPISSRELQQKRLVERDKIPLTAAQDRLNAQMPLTDKIYYADKIVDNSAGLKEVEAQVTTLAITLDSEAGWTWRVSWLFPPWGLFSAGLTLAKRSFRRSVDQWRGKGPHARKQKAGF
jgi:dephospho-CoA kinase